MSASLSLEHVERLRALVAARLGLHFEDDKLESLRDALRARLEESGVSDAETYLARLALPGSARAELQRLAARLTVGETYFFRHPDHFRAFEEAVLPGLLASRAGARRLRLLSAGCASGEEPYSLAIALDRLLPDRTSWQVEVVAIDVNPDALEAARKGEYSEWSLRETDAETRARYFRRSGRAYELDPALRETVTFEERNLKDADAAFWRPGAFDVIFCRNVTMYLEPAVTRAAIARFGRALGPGGHLFLGYAETLRGISSEFHLCHTHETFYYRMRALDEPRPEPRIEPEPHAEPAPWLPEPDASWVEAIQRSSDRIATLVTAPPDSGARAGPAPAGRWNLHEPLDLLRQERFGAALESVRALPDAARDDPDALLLQGVLLVNTGQVKEAERVSARVLAADELNAGAHYVMALCRERAGDLAGAADHDRTAAYLDAGFAMPHFHLGLLAQRRGDAAGARRALETALTLFSREDAARILLFGGGFSREALAGLCRARIQALGGRG
ncbi:MAG: methyltransferase domain-containing protein [Planctomycetota bacterium]|nr:methyltransferase domain-containing protein [Planctomycetota bacterium]